MVTRKTERTFGGGVLHWIKEAIEELKLPFDASIEERIEVSGKIPDIYIWDEKRKPACVISLKRPEYNGYSLEIMGEACGWASQIGAPFFAVWLEMLNRIEAFTPTRTT